jgi:hypothetical protein
MFLLEKNMFVCASSFLLFWDRQLPRAQAADMPLGATEGAAVEGFLRSKRGQRALHEHVVVQLLAFFVANRANKR